MHPPAHHNLYICRSPLQLLNCIEACEKFGKNNASNTLICAWRAEIDRQMMLHLLNLYPHWSEVYFFSLYPTKNQMPVMLNAFRKRRNFDNLFYGDSTHLINIFLNKVGRFRNIYIVDDGAATILFAKKIADRSLHSTRKNNTPRSRLSTYLQATLGLSPTFLYKAKFFTFYPINNPKLDGRIIPNKLDFIKSRIQKVPTSQEIWFIGSNIRDLVLRNKLDYENFLAQINQRIDLSKVVYIPHRKEHDAHLAEISNRFNMKIRRLESIIEFELTRIETLPKLIISFGSSALDTIDILAKTPIMVFRIPSHSIQTPLQPACHDAYESMSQKGFQMIDLDIPTDS